MNKKPTSVVAAALAALFSFTLLVTACSRTRDANAGTSTASTASSTTPAAGDMTAATTSPTTMDSWESLKAYSYDKRTEFASKANDFANRLDQRVQNAKGETSTRLAEARDELRTAANEVSNATADTWDATKERVGRAWQKAESAVQNVAE